MDPRLIEAQIRAAEINRREASRNANRPPLDGPIVFDRYSLRNTVAAELKRRMAMLVYTGESGEEWMVPASTAYLASEPVSWRVCAMRWCDGDVRVVRVLIANENLGQAAPLDFAQALEWMALLVGDASVSHGWVLGPPRVDLPWQFVFHADDDWRVVPPPGQWQRILQKTHTRIPDYISMLAGKPVIA